MVSVHGKCECKKFAPRHEARCTNPCTAVQVEKWQRYFSPILAWKLGRIPLAALVGCQAFAWPPFQLHQTPCGSCCGWRETDGKHSFESWHWFLWRVLQHIIEFYQIFPWMGCLQNACKNVSCIPGHLGTSRNICTSSQLNETCLPQEM